MNEQTKRAIANFVELTPKAIDAAIHSTDRSRVFDIAIAAFETNETLSDVYEELGALLQENKFINATELLKSVKHDIGLIFEFLKYQQKK